MGSAGLALLRWLLAVQYFAVRRLFRSCMTYVDRAELSAKLAAADLHRNALQEALAKEQADKEKLQASLKQADLVVAQAQARVSHCEAQARAATAEAARLWS